ncbi:MAG: hypothetical protein H7Y59_01885 [Anaerolineales bacterium]|nr:hypothetical protein [Anaerolineales bacterium]
MKRIWFPFITLFAFWLFFASNSTIVQAQDPTATPGVSSTGMFITVITDEPQINIRMGPSSSIYPVVGILLQGATAPALGRSQGGDWIQIEFEGAPFNKGWVYSPLVQVSPQGGTLLIIESPPTPVPPATATIDLTLAAQFVIVPTTTRPPTFTPPPALTTLTYTEVSSPSTTTSVPLGIIIVAFAILGVIGFLLSLITRR